MTEDRSVSRRSFTAKGILAALGAVAAPSAIVGAQKASAAPPTAASTLAQTALLDGTLAGNGSISATNTAINGLTGWYVPSDWGQSWRAKLTAAAAGKGTAVASIVGDSAAFGYWASDMSTTAWPELLRAKLQTVAGNGGSGFSSQARSPAVMYNVNSGVSNYYKSVARNVWTATSNWSAVGSPYVYGPGTGALICSGSGTISNSVYGTQLGIWYYDGGSPFTVSIDGKTVGTVTPGSSYLPAHTTFSAGSLGWHNWSITCNYSTSVALGSIISGVEGLASTGARIDNFSFPGAYSSFVSNADSPYYTGTYMGGWRNPADLVIYELGGNDFAGRDPNYPNGTPPDIFAKYVQNYLAGVVNTTYGGNSQGNVDILLLLLPFNLTGDTNGLSAAYKSRLLGIAQGFGAAMLDVNALFHGSWNKWQMAGNAGNQTTPAQSGNDYNHPSDAGHTYIYSQLAPLLSATS